MNDDIRKLFPVTRKYIYLNHAAVSPLALPVVEAMHGIIKDVSDNGVVNYQHWLKRYMEVRAMVAQLVNARPEQITFMRNTSDGLSAIANGYDWRAGDNLVTCNVEFPANIYPWLRLKAEVGIEVRMAEERDTRIDIDEMLSLVDERTRMISISFVEFASGFRFDLARIGKFCREREILFVVDAIQGLGALSLNVERDCIDAFAADSHKWLLGTEGVGVFYISDRALELIKPTVVGWMSVNDWENYLDYRLNYRPGALRFECGTPNTVGIYGLGGALEMILGVGIEKIESYLIELGDYLCEGLQSKGYTVVSSRRDGEKSAIICCAHQKHSPASLYHRLKAQNVICAPRCGRLRISPHFYNTKDEIDTLLDLLPE